MKVIHIILILAISYVMYGFYTRNSYTIYRDKELGDCASKYKEQPAYGPKKWIMKSICDRDSWCTAFDNRGIFYNCKDCSCLIDSPGRVTWIKHGRPESRGEREGVH